MVCGGGHRFCALAAWRRSSTAIDLRRCCMDCVCRNARRTGAEKMALQLRLNEANDEIQRLKEAYEHDDPLRLSYLDSFWDFIPAVIGEYRHTTNPSDQTLQR